MFRSTRSSASSFGRPPAYRSRSLSTLSTRSTHKDPTYEMSKIRDHDLTTNIEAKAVMGLIDLVLRVFQRGSVSAILDRLRTS